MLSIYHHTCKRYSTRPGSLVGLLESFPEPQSKIMEGSSGMAVSLPWYARNLLCDSTTTTGEVSENPWLKIDRPKLNLNGLVLKKMKKIAPLGVL